MASGGSGGVSVSALWSEVNRYGQNGDFTRALKTVNKSRYPGGWRGGPGPAEGCGLLGARATTSEGTPGGETRAAGGPARSPGERGGRGSQTLQAVWLPALGLGLFRATCTSVFPSPAGSKGGI